MARVAEARGAGHLVALTKADLRPGDPGPGGALILSSQTGQGLDALMAALCDRLFPPEEPGEEFWIASERQVECVGQAAEAVERAIGLLEGGAAAPELVAFELLAVRNALRTITGEISSEAILGKIFANFCIGK